VEKRLHTLLRHPETPESQSEKIIPRLIEILDLIVFVPNLSATETPERHHCPAGNVDAAVVNL
jgi:hypothetical protein